ncbi:hypothetical protein HZA56_00835 [Candidatus Poribacteria bacterium]|nr:hypothetical protein [Candidatus Poribacteria bacterium]
MAWESVKNGVVRRCTLEDGTAVVAFIKGGGGTEELSFCADTSDIENIGSESQKLGNLSDFIERLRPEDLIDICCLADKLSKAV